MKRFIYYIVAALSITFLGSCEKIKDDADYFVGTWDLHVFTTWEWIGYNKTGTNIEQEVIKITKISANKVKIAGA